MVEKKVKQKRTQKQRQKQSQTQIVNLTVGEVKSTRKRAPRKPRGPGGGGGATPSAGKSMILPGYQRPPVVYFEPNVVPRATTIVQQPPQNPPPAPPGAGAIAINPIVGTALVPETRQQLDAEAGAVRASAMQRRRSLLSGTERGPSIFGFGGQLVGRARESEPEPTVMSSVSGMTSVSSSAMTRNRPYTSGRIIPSAAAAEVEEPEPTMYAPPVQSYEERPVSEGGVMLKSISMFGPRSVPRSDLFGSMDSNVMRALSSAASNDVLPDVVNDVPPVEEVPEDVPPPTVVAASAGAGGAMAPDLPALTGQALKSLVFTQAQSLWSNYYDELRDSERKTIRRAFTESSTSGKEYDALRAVIKRFNERQR